MALAQIIPGTTPFGSWADDAPIPPAGTSDAKVIARWRTIPFQTFRKISPSDPTEVRVLIALNTYHINGISRVDFAAQEGAYVSVTRPIEARFLPSANDFPLAAAPTFGNVWHGGCYVAVLRGQDFSGASGQVEIRAKVFTPDGHGRILQDSDGQDLGDKSLTLWIDANDGLTKFPIAYIQPGWMGSWVAL
jgi:hypothetical protein